LRTPYLFLLGTFTDTPNTHTAPQHYFKSLTLAEQSPYIAEHNARSLEYFQSKAADPAFASRRKVFIKKVCKLTGLTTAAGVVSAANAVAATPRLKPGRPRAAMPDNWVKLTEGQKVVYYDSRDDSVWFTVPPRSGGRAAMQAYLGKASKKSSKALAVVEEAAPAPEAPPAAPVTASAELEFSLDELAALMDSEAPAPAATPTPKTAEEAETAVEEAETAVEEEEAAAVEEEEEAAQAVAPVPQRKRKASSALPKAKAAKRKTAKTASK
jgi:hypothetical protein